MGFSAAVAQVLVIRELLAVFRGNELVIGIIFAGWFAGIYLGARFAPAADGERSARFLQAAPCVLPLGACIVVYLAHALPLLGGRAIGSHYPLILEMLLSLILTVPLSLPIGRFFPPLVSLLARERGSAAGGTAYAIESLGSFAGGLVFSIVFVDHINPIGITALLFCIGMMPCLYAHARAALYPLALLPLAIAAMSSSIESSLLAAMWNRTHAGALVEYHRTRHQAVQVESQDGQMNIYGDGVFYYSLPDRHDARGLFHLIQSLRNGTGERVLLFGTGPGSLPYNLGKSDVARVDYCEPDPALWEITDAYRRRFYPRDDGRLHVITADLRRYFRENDVRYDIIVSRAAAPENVMLNRFHTKEYFEQCRAHLKPDGVFITAVHGFSNYLSDDLLLFIASIYKGFRETFPHHRITSGDTMYLIGSPDPSRLPDDPASLIARYRAALEKKPLTGLEDDIITNFVPDELLMSFEKTQINYFQDKIDRILTSVDANSDHRPLGYWNLVKLSAYQEESAVYSIFRHAPIVPAIGCVLVALALIDARRRFPGVGFAANATMFATGCASMAAMIVLMILYQNANGIIYYRISLMNALFMFGLTAGSWLATAHRLPSLPVRLILLMASLGGILLYASRSVEPLFWLLIAAISLLSGTIFPSLFSLSDNDGHHAFAASLDAMEHLGSIVGAAATAMLLIPLLGMSSAIAACMCIVAFSALVLLVSGVRKA